MYICKLYACLVPVEIGIRHPAPTGNKTPVLCKSNKSSLPLSYFTSPLSFLNYWSSTLGDIVAVFGPADILFSYVWGM